MKLTDLYLDSLKYLLPAEKIGLADYAEKYRRLNNRGGGYIGNWSNKVVPYLVDIMDAIDDKEVSSVSIVGSGQSGKTSVAMNWFMKTAHLEPCNFLWYAQTQNALESMVKSVLNPLIEQHEFISERLGRAIVDDSISFKKFTGMSSEWLTATTNNLISKSAPRIVADEIDAWNTDLGDVKTLLDIRRQAFSSSKLVMISHPDMAVGTDPEVWASGGGIMQQYCDSDRMIWWWPCPHCGQWSSPAPNAQYQTMLRIPKSDDPKIPLTLDTVELQARLLCPHCDGEIEDSMRREMNLQGKWISQYANVSPDGTYICHRAKAKHRGFWILGVMSPFAMGGIGGLARSVAKAEAEMAKTGDGTSLKQVYAKQLGIPYCPPKGERGSVDANMLAERANENRWEKGVVVEGVRFLLASVDVQKNRFEYMVRGWGRYNESWVIDHGVIDCYPAREPAAWDKLLTQVYHKAFPLNDGSGRKMKVTAMTIDSGGEDGVSELCYGFWRKCQQRGYARRLNDNEGKQVWTIIPYKGAGNLLSSSAGSIRVNFPNAQKKGKPAEMIPMPLLIGQANMLKDTIATLINFDREPNAINFPYWMCNPAGPPHKLLEQICSSERRLANGRWENPSRSRNEMLDLLVMTQALAQLHFIGLIDWDKPELSLPGWLRDWDTNNMILRVGEHSQPEGPRSKSLTRLLGGIA